MANKKVIGNLKLRVPGGRATAGPPVGSTLGQWGLNMMDFINPFNEQTKEYQGKDVIVHIKVYEDRSFDWVCLGKNGPRSQKDIELSTDSYSPSKFDKTTRCINGNLELSATRRAVPYAVYVAHGDIVLDSRAEDGYDGCGLGYRAPFFYWEESATSIKEKLNVTC